jgi:uncharacterized protein YkwD
MKVDRFHITWTACLLIIGPILIENGCPAAALSSSDGKSQAQTLPEQTSELTMVGPSLMPETPTLAPVAGKNPSAAGNSPASGAPKPAASANTVKNTVGPAASGRPPYNPASQTPALPAADATPKAPVSSGEATSTSATAKSSFDSVDNYPIVGRMESLVFGAPRLQNPIELRLGDLEQLTFQQQYPTKSLFDRTEGLKATILGIAEEPSAVDSIGVNIDPFLKNRSKDNHGLSFLDEIANRPENAVGVDNEQIKRFALELVNYLRAQALVGPLTWNDIAQKMAQEQISDLAKRNLVSHVSEKGENPDLRYTKCGGTDAVVECLASTKIVSSSSPVTRAQVAQLVKTLMGREDDRDAVLSPDATGLGFAAAHTATTPSMLGCFEVVTKHAVVDPISDPLALGAKVEVKGYVEQPYHFEKISLAWEGQASLATAADEGDEALPYFPPLDYVAFAPKAEHDYEKAMAALRFTGLVAAIAGGVFIPPVALAAPMIAASGSISEPKPLSDIPVHGGVRIDGANFSTKIPFSNIGKDGIYYLTIWASSSSGGKAIPISRRAFVLTAAPGSHEATSGKHAEKRRT